MLTRRQLLLASAAAPAAAQILKVDPVRMPEIPVAAPAAPGSAPAPMAAAKWKMTFFHDEAESKMVLTDLAAPTESLAFATGVLVGRRGGRPANFGLVTRDGGAKWDFVKLPGVPVSVFGLGAEHLWVVCGRSLYVSRDHGAKWQKLSLPKRMGRVCFVTPQTGFAHGAGKTFYRTMDGGRRWTPVAESEQLKLTDENTVLGAMDFIDGKVGMLAGHSRRLDTEEREFEDWMKPEQALSRRPKPTTTVVLTSLDGGASWGSAVTSAFGDVQRVRLRGKRGAVLMSYGEGFVWPTEVFRSDLATGKSVPLFRRRGQRVTDVALMGETGYLVAVIEPFGQLPGAGLPGRLRMVWSPDGEQWFQMPVDYRAQGPAARMAGDARRHVALSNGMILTLEV